VRSWCHVSAPSWANRTCRNIGVLQTTVAELVTDERHQRKFSPVHAIRLHVYPNSDSGVARAYSIMPFVWCLGYVFF